MILSEELESPGSLRDEIKQTVDYRHEAIDQPTPPSEPSDFLQQRIQQTQERAHSLARLLSDSTDGTNDRLLNGLPERCEQDSDRLESASKNLSSVVVLLGFDYGDYIHDCNQIRSNHEEERHWRLFATLDALISDLENLNVSQQDFTTAFMKEELQRSLDYSFMSASFPSQCPLRSATNSPPVLGRLPLCQCYLPSPSLR